jgi:hypothetical protein
MTLYADDLYINCMRIVIVEAQARSSDNSANVTWRNEYTGFEIVCCICSGLFIDTYSSSTPCL